MKPWIWTLAALSLVPLAGAPGAAQEKATGAKACFSKLKSLAGEVPEGGTDVVQKPGRLSPEEIEERRERLRKLREDRDQRRGRLGELPVGPNIAPRGTVRDRVRKTALEGRDGAKVPAEKADEGEEE